MTDFRALFGLNDLGIREMTREDFEFVREGIEVAIVGAKDHRVAIEWAKEIEYVARRSIHERLMMKRLGDRQ